MSAGRGAGGTGNGGGRGGPDRRTGGIGGWLPDGLHRVLRIGLAGGDADRDVDRELEHHFERTVEDLVASGMTEADARAEAHRRFGDEGRYRRELHRLARGRDRRWRMVERMRRAAWAFLEAFRGVRRAPALALAVVLIMSLGVGANATMFGIMDRVFLRPPAHVEDADQVRRIFIHRQGFNGRMVTGSYHSYPDYADWRELEVFASTGAFSPRELTVGHGPAAERRNVTLATGGFFGLLGVEPALGRFFQPSEDRLGGDRVAVLGHGYWRSRFGGDPSVLGTTLDVGAATYTVVGVTPPGFTGVELRGVDIWLPFHVAGEVEEGGSEWTDSRNWYWFQAIARLADGATPAAAEAAATTVHRVGRADDEDYDPDAEVQLASLILARTAQATDEARVVPWLMGVALLVLLLTCANVANLLLARAVQRRRETAVRLALGTSRGRLIGTVMAESVILAVLGGGAAVALAFWGGDLLRAFLLPDIAWSEPATPTRVVLFSAAVAVGAGLLAGLIPAVRYGRPDVAEALKGQGRGSSPGRSRLRTGLLVFQAAVSVVLLVGTSLFVVSLDRARDLDLGYDPRHVLFVRIEPEGGYPGGERMVQIYREALDRTVSMPGVESAALATVAPFRNSRGIGDDLRVPGLDSLPRTPAGGAYINAVTGAFFETMGLAVLRGRGLTDADDAATAPPVAVVNQTMAELVWPDRDPIGRCLVIRDGPCTSVVGIVEDSRRFDIVEDASMKYYVPLARAPYPWPPSRLMVRTSQPETLAPALQRTLVASLSGVRLVTAEPFARVVGPQYRSWQLGATLFGAFGLLALLVAAVGLYSVLAFDMARRRRELGVRVALGAGRRRILGNVLGAGLRVTGLGIVLGLAGVALAARWIEVLLFRVSPYDPVILGGVAAAMLVVATAASAVPALRATRVDPREALQAE